jgi:hypothetical protein
MAVCKENLSDSDRAFLSSIETLDDCKGTIAQLQCRSTQSNGASIFQQVSPILDPLFHLVTLVTACLTKGNIQTALVWGLITLVVRVHKPYKVSVEPPLTVTGRESNEKAS